MKLKILLMPVAIIISSVLIIWHIYPAWFGDDLSNIANSNIEVEKIEKEISDIRERKGNVQKLTQSLDLNLETEILINRFYPTYRNDEDVVNSINNIAFTEGVFLVDMGVEYKNIELADDPARVLSIPFEKSNPVLDSTQIAPDGSVPVVEVDEYGIPLADLEKKKIKFIETSLKVYGSYDQIKKFMTALNRAGLINNIQSFKVYKEEDKEAATEAAEKSNADILNVDMVVGFAYFLADKEKASTLLTKDLFKGGEFDFTSIDNKKEILTGNYKKSEVGETGLTNPFQKEGATE